MRFARPKEDIIMLYDLPFRTRPQAPDWGTCGIPARLPDGTAVRLPVMAGVNALTVGVVGTGKTRSYTLPAARLLLEADPQLKAVFFEIKRTFIDCFLSGRDKVIAQDPASVPSEHLFCPSIIREIRQAQDPEAEMREVAEFLFRDLLEGANQNRAWVEAARNALVGVLRVIVRCFPHENTSNRTLAATLRRMTAQELLTYLAKHPRNHSMLRKDWGADPLHPADYVPTRRAGDILFFMNQALEAFSGSFALDGGDTIRDWISGRHGRHLFFLYDLASAQICRPWFLYYLKKIKDCKMSNTHDPSGPILMVLDEIDKMADGGKTADWGLWQAATLGREAGLQLLVTTQSIENLYGLSPDFNEHITRGGLSGFPILLSFRPGDPTTIQTLQALFGSRRREILTMPLSRYDSPVVKSELEPVVTDADFASLGTGECYVKVRSQEPVRVAVTPTGSAQRGK